MIRIGLLAHGSFAEGMLSALTLIAGEGRQIFVLGLRPDERPEEYRERLIAVLPTSPDESVLLCTDLFGGTPCNVGTAVALGRPNVYLVAGVSLAGLLEAVMAPESLALAELAERVRCATAESVRTVVVGGTLSVA